MVYDDRPMYLINGTPEPEIKPVVRPRVKWASRVLAESAARPRGKISPLLAEYMKKEKKE